MNPPIKKLSVLFLIGAILTSSLALSVNALINRVSPNSNIQQEGASAETNDYKIYGAGPNGQNLTEEVSDIFARQLVEANPQGPQQNEDGSVQLFSPTSTDLLAYLSTNAPSEDVLIQPIDDSKIKIIQNFEVGDVSHYLSQITQVQNDVTSDPIWQVGLSTSTMSDAAGASIALETGKTFADARDEMYDIKVPAPFTSMHKSLLAFFSTTASFLDIATRDPVAAMALSNKLDGIVAAQSEDMEKAVIDIQKNFPEYLSILPREDNSKLTKIFGIQTAYATWPTIDWAAIGHWIQDNWDKYKSIIQATALGTLKNFLMQKIGQKIIKWAQGAGVPGYVQSWALFEISAGFDAATGSIRKEQAKLCGNAATTGLYGNILASAMGVSTQDLGVGGVVQTVGETEGCPTISSGFYGRGGYSPENFLQSLAHNTYGDILKLENQSIKAAAQASQAAVNEGLSGRGSLDVKKCADGSTPGDGASAAEPAGDDSVGPQLPPNLRCADGSAAQTLTPGSAKQELISKALSGAQDIIAGVNNENTYGAIVQVLTNALVTYALKEGEGIFSDSFGSGGTTPPPPPADSTTERQLTWYVDSLETALTLAQGAVTNINDARDRFQTILTNGQCAEALGEDLLGYINQTDQALIVFDPRLQEIQSLLDAVHQLQQNPPVTQAQLDAVGSTANITALVTRSQGDYDAASVLLDQANGLFDSEECTPT